MIDKGIWDIWEGNELQYTLEKREEWKKWKSKNWLPEERGEIARRLADCSKRLFPVICVIKNGRYTENTKFKFISLINKLRSSLQVKKIGEGIVTS